MATDKRDPGTLDPSKDKVRRYVENGMHIEEWTSGAHVADASDFPPPRDDSQFNNSSESVPRPGVVGKK